VSRRERFWIDESPTLPGLDPPLPRRRHRRVFILSTCNRTEFFSLGERCHPAANSVMRLLAPTWTKARRSGSTSIACSTSRPVPIFRVVSRLDSLVVGAPQIVPQAKAAWQQAQKSEPLPASSTPSAQSSCRLRSALPGRRAIAKAACSIPSTAVKLARQDLRPARQ